MEDGAGGGMLERCARLSGWLALLVIPLRVLTLGFLPTDDALRHAAKAVTDRSWQEILVLRPEVTVDSHPGWHFLLGLIHRAFGAAPVDLVFISVAALFAVLLGVALAMSRTHAWALACLLVPVCDSNVTQRWFSGRPFLLASAVVLALAISWSRGRLPQARDARWMVPLFTVLIWIHPSYYLWALPVAALLLSGKVREAVALGLAVAGGTLGAALLSGSPLAFLVQNTMHPIWSFGAPASELVGEFQPSPGAPVLVAVVLAVFLAGRARRAGLRASDPTFVLAALGWALGFFSARFWVDWGVPATLAWGIGVVDDATPDLDAARAGRLALASVAACVLCLTSDDLGRWSRTDTTYRALAAPEQAAALPDPGGILYSDDMFAFYQVFFRRPDAPFRFVLGFERGLMRPEDAAVLRGASQRGDDRFRPWASRMTRRDRLVVQVVNPGSTYGLQWTHVSGNVWSGRVPPTSR